MEPPKTPLGYDLITWAWVLCLAIFGGVANFFKKLQSGEVRAFNLVEMVGEIVVSAFAGVITFMLCEWANIDKMLSAALIGIAGHMGSRGIFLFEKILEKRAKKIMLDNEK